MTESIEYLLDEYHAPRRSARITMRADLLARHGELWDEHARAIRHDMATNEPDTAPAILAEIHELEDEVAASERTFTFEALGSHKLRRVEVRHPPSNEDRKAQRTFNPDTFIPALLAASCVSHEMTEEQARTLVDTLSEGQITKLWNAAYGVNVGDDLAPKSVRASATTEQAALSSSTALPEESPSASSSGE